VTYTARELLDMFYREWLEWAESGAPEGGTMVSDAGLCDNLRFWCCDRELSSDDRWDVTGVLERDLGPYDGYSPFESDGEYMSNRRCDLTPARLEFVRRRLGLSPDGA